MIIVYIGNVGYPDTASSIHVRNRGIFMKTFGHEVHVLCELASDGKRMEEVDELTYQYMDPYPGRGKIRGAYWNLDQVFGKIYFEQTNRKTSRIKFNRHHRPEYRRVSLYCSRGCFCFSKMHKTVYYLYNCIKSINY